MTNYEQSPDRQSVGWLASRRKEIAEAIEALKQEESSIDVVLFSALESYVGSQKTLPVLKAQSTWYQNEAGTIRSFVDHNDNYIDVVIPSGHYLVHDSPDYKRGDFALSPAGWQLPHRSARSVLIRLATCGLELFHDVEAEAPADGHTARPVSAGGAMALRSAASSGLTLEY